MKNILFYKFIELHELQGLRWRIANKCEALKGKILIAEEGINGCVSGQDEDIAAFMEYIQSELGPIEFKVGLTTDHTFKKMFVRIRSEIITFKQQVKVDAAASYIEPQELKAALDNGEEIILLDARNKYESVIGKFSGAIAPDIDIFSQLPEVLSKLEDLKTKRIVTYCTGGIRCEKSSAWMRQNGFTNVQQLHGGIIRYGEECGNDHWEGKCFVFDRRGAINIDPSKQSTPITNCELCNAPSDDYHNCANALCDKYFLCCPSCLQSQKSCCSKACRIAILAKPEHRAVTFLDEERPKQMS